MNDDTLVLGAMLRLARRGLEATVDELYERVGTDRTRIRSALGRLDAAGLVERRTASARRSMSGLALSVATLPADGMSRRAAPGVVRRSARTVQGRPKLRSHAA